MSWLNWIYICICCLLWDVWMDLMPSDQIWVSLNGYDHEMTSYKWYEWIYVLWKYSNKLASSLIHICWSIAQLLKSVFIEQSEWAVILAMFGLSNLIGLAWNLVYMIYTYSTSCCTNFMMIGLGTLQFWSGSCQL